MAAAYQKPDSVARHPAREPLPERLPERTAGRLTERSLIASLARARRSSTLALGIGDDCAILRPPAGHEILVTTDFSLEGRHFRRDWHPAHSAGHRCLARGLSDLAAMGANPLAAFLSLAIPPEVAASLKGKKWVTGFLAGLQALAVANRTPLAGGDTAASPSDHILADIVLLGSAPAGRSLRRSEARPGDLLYVTGALGGAAAELAALSSHPRRFLKAEPSDVASPSKLTAPSKLSSHPHLFPSPRLAVGQTLLRRSLASACIDLSDGLSTDLDHLCDESHVAAVVEEALLPIHPLASRLSASRIGEAILNGGEDYELLFTTPATTRIPALIAGVPITRIGTITRRKRSAPKMTLITKAGLYTALEPAGYEHLG